MIDAARITRCTALLAGHGGVLLKLSDMWAFSGYAWGSLVPSMAFHGGASIAGLICVYWALGPIFDRDGIPATSQIFAEMLSAILLLVTLITFIFAAVFLPL